MFAPIRRLFAPRPAPIALPRAKAALLADTLFSDLFDDVCDGRIPSEPGPSHEILSFGPFDVVHTLRSIEQTVSIFEHRVWIGTLVLHRGGPEPRGFPRFSCTVPGSDQAALDRLLDIALDIARRDARARGKVERLLDAVFDALHRASEPAHPMAVA